MGSTITLFSLMVILSVCMFFFGMTNCKENNNGEKFSFYRNYSYEFNDYYRMNFTWVYRGFLFALVGVTIAFLFVTTKYPQDERATAFIILSSISLFLFLIFGLLPMRYYKTHILCACLYFLISAGACFGFSYFAMPNPDHEFSIVFMTISIVLGAIILLLCCNPLLLKWNQMSKVVEADNSITYKRPRIIFLAFTEWLVFFLNFALYLLAFIYYFMI